jgi:hypothetical protein
MIGRILLGIGAVLALGAMGGGRSVKLVQGKRYRVTSKLRGQMNLQLVADGLAEAGATDVTFGGGPHESASSTVLYTIEATRDRVLELGKSSFVFEDAKTHEKVTLTVDAVKETT